MTLIAGAFTPSVVLAVARTLGLLDEHGLDVVEVPVTSSPDQFRALLAGAIDIAFTSPDNVPAYRFSPRNPLGGTADVRIVAALDRGTGLALYGRPGLELRGAVLGVDVPTSGFALAMYAVTDSLGVAREEYELVALGSTPRRREALPAGKCDATLLNAGNDLLAERAGFVPLARVADVCAPYLGSVLAVAGTGRVAEARAQAAALRRTASLVLSGAADEETRTAAMRILGLDRALAIRYLDRLKNPREGLIEDDDYAGLATVTDLRRRYLPEADVADWSSGMVD